MTDSSNEEPDGYREADDPLLENRPQEDGRSLRDFRTSEQTFYVGFLKMEGSHTEGFSVSFNLEESETELDGSLREFSPPFARRKASVFCLLVMSYFQKHGAILPTIDTKKGEIIPTKVAVMGKPAMVAYMRTVQKSSREHVAETLEITPETVRQYMNDIARRRRELID